MEELNGDDDNDGGGGDDNDDDDEEGAYPISSVLAAALSTMYIHTTTPPQLGRGIDRLFHRPPDLGAAALASQVISSRAH